MSSRKRTSRPKDVEELVAGMRRQIKGLERRGVEEDPWVAAEMLTLAAELEAAATRTVGALRAAGYTWEGIGQELGLSRQAAFMRFSKKIAK